MRTAFKEFALFTYLNHKIEPTESKKITFYYCTYQKDKSQTFNLYILSLEAKILENVLRFLP